MGLSAFLLIAFAISCTMAQGDGLTVHTAQGDVVGNQVSSTVRQFLGIPYATVNRWEAPAAPPIRTSTLQANSFSESCVQLMNDASIEFLTLSGAGGLDVQQSETCHTVNIWSPSISRKQGTAVMVWIYGGGFDFGTSNLTAYNGQNFVRDNDDVTIVTLNYRLNIFGQPSAPQFANSTQAQNFGLLDIDAAIQWVHSNIAAFGGDPNRIVLFGQSAGSIATDAYTYAHPHDTIVKGVIQESGTIALVNSGVLGNPTFDATSWNKVASALGCGSDGSAAQLACMKAVPFATLQQTVRSTGVSFGLVTDEITIFSDTRDRAAAGNFLRVPVLGGSTAQEGNIFVVAEELITLGSTVPGVTDVLADLVTQIAFTCPAQVNAQDRASANVPTWRYQYQAVFPDISTRPDLKAYHASEIPIVFGTYNVSTAGVPPTANEIALSKYVQSAWVAFARDPAHGLVNFGWPTYNSSTKSLAQLGNSANPAGVTFELGLLLDATCIGAQSLLSFAGQLSKILGRI